LKDNGFGLVVSHNSLNDWLKDGLVGDIVNAISKREVDRIIFALTNADWPALVVDKTGAIVRANPAATRIFGAASRKGALLGTICAADNAAALQKLLAEPPPGRRGGHQCQRRGLAS